MFITPIHIHLCVFWGRRRGEKFWLRKMGICDLIPNRSATSDRTGPTKANLHPNTQEQCSAIGDMLWPLCPGSRGTAGSPEQGQGSGSAAPCPSCLPQTHAETLPPDCTNGQRATGELPVPPCPASAPHIPAKGDVLG